MRITAIFLFIACMQVSATGFSQKINLNEKNAALKLVIQKIKKQSGYHVIYRDEWMALAKNVTITLKDAKLEEALEACFKNQLLSYSIIDNTIVIQKRPDSVKSDLSALGMERPPVDVKGTVADEEGEPLAGVTVTIKGTGIATATNASGQFTLNGVAENAVLVFTASNIERKEIQLNNRSEILVVLKLKVDELNQVTVVNTGYQTISKERSAGAYSKPNMDVFKNRSSSMNILQRLDGLVPGLVVNNAPDAATNPFLIRGLSTVGTSTDGNYAGAGSNRNPLYVVDGIPVANLSTINPQDVADITVLKDATATSIWGTRATNGVIVITTKKGSKREKIRLQYDGFVTFQPKPDLSYIQKLSTSNYIKAAKELFDPVRFPYNEQSALGALSPDQIILYNMDRGIIDQQQGNKSLDSLASLDNNGQIKDNFYRSQMLSNHTLSASGGGDVYSFYGSMSYTNTRSEIPGEKNNIYKLNFRQDLKLGSRIRLNLITDVSNAITSSNNNISISTRFLPYQLFKDANGNPLTVNYLGDFSDERRTQVEELSRINMNYVPLNEQGYGKSNNNVLVARLVGGLKVDIVKGLSFEGTYGFNQSNSSGRSYLDAKNYIVRRELVGFTVNADPATDPVYYLPSTGGRYSEQNALSRDWTVRNQLLYNNSWDKHQLTVLAGQEASEYYLRNNTMTVRGWDDALQTYQPVDYKTLAGGINNPVAVINNVGSTSYLTDDNFTGGEQPLARSKSYYSNLSYSYNRKYTINGSYRVDESNLFGKDKSAQNKPIWSVGGKWMLGSEKFLAKTKWIEKLDLRLTYGITGNSPAPGTAASFDILRAVISPNIPSGTGLEIATAGNDKLTWERTKNTNIGIDFTLFGARINGSIDGYFKKTENLIGYLPVNNFTGYTTVVGNFGSIENKGIELSLNTLNMLSKDFLWQAGITLAYNKNRITDLRTASTIQSGDEQVRQRYAVGYSAFTIFAYNYAGLDAEGNPMIRLADGHTTKEPSVSTKDDIVYKGTSQPVWNGGLFNSFSYKRFDLTCNIIFNAGHVLYRDVNTFYSGILGSNPHSEFENRWKQPGDELTTNIPRYNPDNTSSNNRNTDYYTRGNVNILNASFAKIRDIALAYELPDNAIKHLHIEKFRLRCQVSNILIWKANKYGIDPEFQSMAGFSGQRNLRIGQGIFTVGANITF